MDSDRFYKTPHISFALQALYLKAEYPESNCVIRPNELIWYGMIKPTPVSRLYKIKIHCKGLNKRPRVVLYGDIIEGIDRSDFPHHFEIDKVKQEVVLCLHMPCEFNYKLWIADTIIPWTQEWLYYYEIWLATGEWCGGGHTPKKYK